MIFEFYFLYHLIVKYVDHIRESSKRERYRELRLSYYLLNPEDQMWESQVHTEEYRSAPVENSSKTPCNNG